MRNIKIIRDLKNKIIYNLDMKLAAALIILSILFILIPPFNQTFLRIILALPLLLFLPGYLFICVMFPGRSELGSIERLTLSIGLSIAITVFDGFALNYTPWGFRPNSIVISLSVIMGILLIVTNHQRSKLKEKGYTFSSEDIIAFYRVLTSKKTETGPEYDPALEQTLIKTMVFLILLVSAVVVYANVARVPEKFTAFYILGSNGMAENYPSEIYINIPTKILVGIENHEYEPVNYTIRVVFGGQILKEQEVHLEHDAKWLENVTFTPRLTSSIALAGTDSKSKLEFILMKDNIPYRSVHLLVKSIFNTNEYAPAITLFNGDMEQDSGWNFTSSSENITGTYANDSWASPFRSYEMNITSSAAGGYGEFYQNLTVDRETLATISFYTRDSAPNATTNITRQVLVGGNVIWEAGVGNKSWEQMRVPVFASKNVRLAFRVYNKIPVNDTVQVWWDNIEIGAYTNESTEQSPKHVVLSNNVPQREFRIRGMPINIKENAKIDGTNFPGFYYDIDENKSYEELNLVFSNNSTVDAGNATYISTVHGNEISLIGSTYKLINMSDTGLLSRILVKNASKTLNLSEKWGIDNGYSLSLSLVSSKGDTAMLELRKGSRLLDSKLLGRGGVFEYRASIAKNTTTIFKAKIDSISPNSVSVKDVELYSDAPDILKAGDSIGDFEITSLSSAGITMKNTDSVDINDGAVMLGGSIRFRVINDTAFPYASSGENRGLPQPILPGSHMDINGLNYPVFYYDLDNKNSFEELSLDLTYNATVDIGKAVYNARSNGSELHFLGDSYWLPNPERINIVSGFSTIRQNLTENGSINLDDGYVLTIKRKPEDSVEVTLRKGMTKSERELLNYTNYSKVFKDIYYEMFVNTDNGRFKSNTLKKGEEFEYWVEYEEDKKFKQFSGKIESMDNLNVTMEIKQYIQPKELLPGMTFGEFEIESITDNAIILRNTQPIKLEPGKDTPILGGAIMIRTSAKEPVAYPAAGGLLFRERSLF